MNVVKNAINHINKNMGKLYKKYSFLGIEEKELKSIFMGLAYNLSEDDKSRNPIGSAISLYVSDLLAKSSQEQVYKYVENFIAISLGNGSDNKDGFYELLKLSKFLRHFRLSCDLSMANYLLTNNKVINNWVEYLFNQNKTSIENGKYLECFTDETVATFLEAMAFIKGIEINYHLDDEDEYEEYEESKELDALTQYKSEARRYKLLTFAEEQELGKRIHEGDQEAVNEMVVHNLRLVYKIAGMYRDTGIDDIELIQEGNMGLMRAAENFDYKKGFKFSTYAVWWIRQGVKRFIDNNSRNIRIPVHVTAQKSKVEKAKEEYTVKHGHLPTIQELAAITRLSEQTVFKIENLPLDTVSIYKDINEGDEDSDELLTFIPAESPTPEEKTIDKVLQKDLKEALTSGFLTQKEVTVLVLRFGLADGVIRTLEQVGMLLHVTRERIRQIEAKALDKCSKNAWFKAKMAGYLTLSADNPNREKFENIQKIKGIKPVYKKKEEKTPRKKPVIPKKPDNGVKVISSVNSKLMQPESFTIEKYNLVKDKLNKRDRQIIGLLCGVDGVKYTPKEVSEMARISLPDVKIIVTYFYDLYFNAINKKNGTVK